MFTLLLYNHCQCSKLCWNNNPPCYYISSIPGYTHMYGYFFNEDQHSQSAFGLTSTCSIVSYKTYVHSESHLWVFHELVAPLLGDTINYIYTSGSRDGNISELWPRWMRDLRWVLVKCKQNVANKLFISRYFNPVVAYIFMYLQQTDKANG